MRQKTHCLVLLLKRAQDIPIQDLQYSQISKLEFQEILGMQKLPVTQVQYKWNTVAKHSAFLRRGGEGGIQSEAVLIQKTSCIHNSSSLKQQLHFSWKFHIQHLLLMNNPCILMLIQSQDKKIHCSLYIFRMYSFTPGERSLTQQTKARPELPSEAPAVV